MYLNFFGLRKTPFGDVGSSSLIWTQQRQDLAAKFHRVIADRQGVTVLTGEDGSGKTAFVRSVLDSLTPLPLKVITLSSEKLSFPRLLQTVTRELDGTAQPQDALSHTSPQTAETLVHPLAPLENIAPLIRALHAALLHHYAQQGGVVVLIVDHAHHLPVKTLKDFHWLSGLETPEGKLLQTIFVGNPTLSLKLEMPQLQLLKRRIAAHGELAPFSFEESFVYLLTRIRAKLGPHPSSPLFSVEALRLLARHGKGNPRFLNNLANAALRAGSARREKPISGPLMLQVIAELRTLPLIDNAIAHVPRTPPRVSRTDVPVLPHVRQVWAAGAGAVAAALFLLFSYTVTKANWTAMFANPVQLLRNSWIALAAPGTEVPPNPPALLSEPNPSQDVSQPPSLPKRTPGGKKRRVIAGIQNNAPDKTPPLAQFPEVKDDKPGQGLHRSPDLTSPQGLDKGAAAPNASAPGKVLYRTLPDPASNKDRLFDE